MNYDTNLIDLTVKPSEKSFPFLTVERNDEIAIFMKRVIMEKESYPEAIAAIITFANNPVEAALISGMLSVNMERKQQRLMETLLSEMLNK